MSVFSLTSCNDDKDELTDSRLTYYVNLEMQGDAFVQVPIPGTGTSGIVASSCELAVWIFAPSRTCAPLADSATAENGLPGPGSASE